MLLNFKNIFDEKSIQRLQRYLRRKTGIHYCKSYSQCGEDLIVDFIFNSLEISKPTYLDIGAHHPYYLNNTYLFYKRGSRGVNVEPDPDLFKKIKKARSNDVNLNIGLASKRGTLKLNIFSSRTLNTFSDAEAKNYIEQGHEIISNIEVDVLVVEDVFSKYFNVVPDYLTLDTEGMDLEIIRSIDNDKYKPIVYCIETVTYSKNGRGVKLDHIDKIMCERGYLKYADTYINTIYIDREKWIERG